MRDGRDRTSSFSGRLCAARCRLNAGPRFPAKPGPQGGGAGGALGGRLGAREGMKVGSPDVHTGKGGSPGMQAGAPPRARSLQSREDKRVRFKAAPVVSCGRGPSRPVPRPPHVHL